MALRRHERRRDEQSVAGGQPDDSEKRVAPLELFFDLVFVFALTQVTALMSDHPTWEGLGQGMLVLVALWWAWGAYAWLTNYIAADEGVERLLMFAAMGAFLIAALAVPRAFGDDALLFGVAYAVARWLHIFICAEANDDVDTGQAIVRLARTALPAPALLIVAGLVDDGTLRAALWIVALASTSPVPTCSACAGSASRAGHFAERFSLIVIIALGESIVAIGAGSAATSTRASSWRRARAGRGLRALVGLLRRGRGRRRAPLPAACPRTSACASRATPTATCTCR